MIFIVFLLLVCWLERNRRYSLARKVLAAPADMNPLVMVAYHVINTLQYPIWKEFTNVLLVVLIWTCRGWMYSVGTTCHQCSVLFVPAYRFHTLAYVNFNYAVDTSDATALVGSSWVSSTIGVQKSVPQWGLRSSGLKMQCSVAQDLHTMFKTGMLNQSHNLSSQPLAVPGAGKGLRRFVEEIGNGVMAWVPQLEMSNSVKMFTSDIPFSTFVIWRCQGRTAVCQTTYRYVSYMFIWKPVVVPFHMPYYSCNPACP